jgi:hypothetical protein
MSILDQLTAAGLPVISAEENGNIIMGPMTPEQDAQFNDLTLQYFNPTAYQDLLQQRADTQALRDAYVTMINRLEQIQSASNPTNAQVVQAIKDEALYLERIMKVLRKMLA